MTATRLTSPRLWMLALCVPLVLAACGNPLRDVPRLEDVPVAEDAGSADALPEATDETTAEALPEPQIAPDTRRRGGLLGIFQRRAEAARAAPAEPDAATPTDPDTAGAETATPTDPDIAVSDSAAPTDADVAGSDSAVPTDADPSAPEGAATADLDPAAIAAAEEVLKETAPDPADDIAAIEEPTLEEPRQRRGLGRLFRRNGRGSAEDVADGPALAAVPAPLSPDAPDFQQVTLGTRLSYGEIARVCDVRPAQLGAKVQSYPESGKGGYTLYDSAPGSTSLRSFYLTGFKDRCARQFTAALVLFGDPETYEQIHYGAPARNQPTALTDRAYEQVKNAFCRVRDGQPCGSRMTALKRDTVFVNVYERFDSNPRWKNILLHDGEVVAMDVKS